MKTALEQIDKQAFRAGERFLKKMVKASGRLPRYLFVSDVRRLGGNPLAGGGFADVWRGEAHGASVALKVLRIFGLAKSSQSLKVCRLMNYFSSYTAAHYI